MTCFDCVTPISATFSLKVLARLSVTPWRKVGSHIVVAIKSVAMVLQSLSQEATKLRRGE